MNATETRNRLRMVIASLADHLGDQLDEFTQRMNENGPRNWRGVGDLEAAASQIARMVSTFSNHAITPEEALATAGECVDACEPC